MNYTLKRLWIAENKREKARWASFLVENNIRPENNVDYSVGVFDDDNLIATGSFFENIIKCVAVEHNYQGGTVFNLLLSHLTNKIYDNNCYSIYVYTKPESVESFTRLGFKFIARVNNSLVFLEKATSGFDDYLKNLTTEKIAAKNISSIVMNANPFTKGHQYLAECASQRSDIVHLFVLSEDLSDFPSDVRLMLVKEGTKHLNNVHVHTTGDYMVSAKTFPSYFLPESADVTKIQAKLDATVFLKIALVLDINRRFVGEEPYSVATNIYNKAMAEVFENNIKLSVIPRKTSLSDVISASRVRALIKENKLEETRLMLPDSSYNFLFTKEGALIIEKIQRK